MFVTTVPKGVCSMTIALLLQNTLAEEAQYLFRVDHELEYSQIIEVKFYWMISFLLYPKFKAGR